MVFVAFLCKNKKRDVSEDQKEQNFSVIQEVTNESHRRACYNKQDTSKRE